MNNLHSGRPFVNRAVRVLTEEVPIPGGTEGKVSDVKVAHTLRLDPGTIVVYDPREANFPTSRLDVRCSPGPYPT
jgi:hypothetical protein